MFRSPLSSGGFALLKGVLVATTCVAAAGVGVQTEYGDTLAEGCNAGDEITRMGCSADGASVPKFVHDSQRVT
jgi:hypothetical protein